MVRSVPYATNDLQIMVQAGNSKGVHSLTDLGKGEIRLSIPTLEWEGIAHQIAASLSKAGGARLRKKVYEEKVQDATTYLTQIHHRETPMRIMQGKSDAGVTWASEVRFQEKIGNPIKGVPIPADQNTTAIYSAGVLQNALHRKAAAAWVAYLNTPAVQAVYREFGFGPAVGDNK